MKFKTWNLEVVLMDKRL